MKITFLLVSHYKNARGLINHFSRFSLSPSFESISLKKIIVIEECNPQRQSHDVSIEYKVFSNHNSTRIRLQRVSSLGVLLDLKWNVNSVTNCQMLQNTLRSLYIYTLKIYNFPKKTNIKIFKFQKSLDLFAPLYIYSIL